MVTATMEQPIAYTNGIERGGTPFGGLFLLIFLLLYFCSLVLSLNVMEYSFDCEITAQVE